MSPRKPGFTREQHFALGGELSDAYAALSKAVVTICAAYPVNGREVKAAERAVAALDMLRCRLDSAAHREAPAEDRDIVNAYYGPRR